MKYKIGDVGKILDLSPDLLRYYEKKGVVTPEKDKYTDYRYYDAWDINFLLDCIWFKNFGFSIGQIAGMVREYTSQDILRHIEDKEEELKAAIRNNELLLERARKYKKEILQAKEFLLKCDIQNSHETVRYLNRHNDEYVNSEAMHKLGHRWLEYIPFTHRSFEIDVPDGSDGGKRDYHWGFSLDMKYVKEFNVEIKPPVVHLPAEKSLHSVFTSSGKANFSPTLIDYMIDYAKKNNLEICGNARGCLICSVVEDGELTGFFEVWIPIK